MYMCSILLYFYSLPISSHIMYTQSRLCTIIRAECRTSCTYSEGVLTGRFQRAAELAGVASCEQDQGVLNNRCLDISIVHYMCAMYQHCMLYSYRMLIQPQINVSVIIDGRLRTAPAVRMHPSPCFIPRHIQLLGGVWWANALPVSTEVHKCDLSVGCDTIIPTAR